MFRFARLLPALLLLASCESGGDPAQPQPVGQVVVTPAILELDELESGKLTAVVRTTSGDVVTDRQVTWTSSRPERFTVDATGMVQALRFGEGSITATAEGIPGSALVRVFELPVAAIDVVGPTSVPRALSIQLSARVLGPAGQELAGRAALFTSDDPSIAAVTSGGLVTGLSEGQATIRATFDGVAGTGTVIVLPEPVGTIEFPSASLIILDGGAATPGVVVRGVSGDELDPQVLTFSSENPDIASVSSSGNVTGVSPGSTRIIASAGDVSAALDVIVTEAARVDIEVAYETSGSPVAGMRIVDDLGADLRTVCITEIDGTCVGILPVGGSVRLSCTTCAAQGGGESVLLENVTVAGAAAFTVEGTEVYLEDFSGTLEASGWTGKGQALSNTSAVFVEDPMDTRNRVVVFERTTIKGDAFSEPIAVDVDATYRIVFDYLGLLEAPRTETDGYLGIANGYPAAHFWFASADRNPSIDPVPVSLADDGVWKTYSVDFVPSDSDPFGDGFLQLMLEDGAGDGGGPGDAFFDNVRLIRLN